jgi:hypothetical protein
MLLGHRPGRSGPDLQVLQRERERVSSRRRSRGDRALGYHSGGLVAARINLVTTDLITLCQEHRVPLEVYEQLLLFDDGLAWQTIVESCPQCEEALTGRSLRVRLRPPSR